MKPVDEYFAKLNEPYQSIMLFVRNCILETSSDFEEKFKGSTPFYHCNHKPCIYFNTLQNPNAVDVVFVKGHILEKEFAILKGRGSRKFARSLSYYDHTSIDQALLIEIIKRAADLNRV